MAPRINRIIATIAFLTLVVSSSAQAGIVASGSDEAIAGAHVIGEITEGTGQVHIEGVAL